MSKVILISGGSDGLGKAIAAKLSPNYQVIILSHNPAKLAAVSQEIKCDFVEAEITDYRSVKEAVDKVISKYGKIDILINNAGIWIEGQLEDNDPDKIRELIGVNVLGYLYLTKAALPSLRGGDGGRIINIVSQDGLRSKKDRSVYTASKWAMTGFTKCLLEDLSGTRVGVTGIYPGLLKTSLFEKQGVSRNLADALDPAEVASLVQYVINLSPEVLIPEIGIKKNNNSNKMDDNSSPQIDINLNPDMMTTQAGVPTVAPAQTGPSTISTPTVSEPVGGGIIDITPGSSSSGDSHPSKIEDITPGSSAVLSAPPITPPTTVVTNPEEGLTAPPIAAPIATPIASTPAPATWETPATKVELPPATPNPLQEDPDLVKINK